MTSQAITPRGTIRAEFGALADSCRTASDELHSTAGNLQRCSQRATTVAAIGLLALGVAVLLVVVQFFRWGMLSQAIASVDSIALMAGGIWLDKIDKRSRADIAAARMAAERVRGESVLLSDALGATPDNGTRETILSQAIATVDSIALTAGGIWLDKTDKRTSADIAAPRRASERARDDVEWARETGDSIVAER